VSSLLFSSRGWEVNSLLFCLQVLSDELRRYRVHAGWCEPGETLRPGVSMSMRQMDWSLSFTKKPALVHTPIVQFSMFTEAEHPSSTAMQHKA